MFESLLALLLFSLAVVGSLQAQRKAVQATHRTLSELRVQQLLQDLPGPLAGDAAEPAVMQFSSAALPDDVPGVLRRWLDRSGQTREALGRARVCVDRADGLATVSIRESAPSGPAGGGCAGAARATLWHVALR
jgi:hypothetical protein